MGGLIGKNCPVALGETLRVNPEPHTGQLISNLSPLALNPRENSTSRPVASKSPAVDHGIDTDLQAVIDAWDTLPEAVKAGIVAMVGAARGK